MGEARFYFCWHDYHFFVLFCFHYAFHSKISINFCVSSPIFCDLHFNYSTFDIHMTQYRLRTAFSLKSLPAASSYSFVYHLTYSKCCLWFPELLLNWGLDLETHIHTTFFNLLKVIVCRIAASAVRCSANAESKAHGI